jgi:hypothetical protein
MEILTVISVALANGMWQVGKKMLESASESALKPAKDQLENRLLKNYKAAENKD